MNDDRLASSFFRLFPHAAAPKEKRPIEPLDQDP